MDSLSDALYVLAVTVEYSSLATPLQAPALGEPGVKVDTFFEEFCSRLKKIGLQKPCPRQTHPTTTKNVFTYWSHSEIMDSVCNPDFLLLAFISSVSNTCRFEAVRKYWAFFKELRVIGDTPLRTCKSDPNEKPAET